VIATLDGARELVLRHACRDRPLDDGPREAYADFLRETGQTARANFVLAQLRLDRRPKFNIGWLAEDHLGDLVPGRSAAKNPQHRHQFARRHGDPGLHILPRGGRLPGRHGVPDASGPFVTYVRGLPGVLAARLQAMAGNLATLMAYPWLLLLPTDHRPDFVAFTEGSRGGRRAWARGDGFDRMQYHPASRLAGDLFELLPGGELLADRRRAYPNYALAMKAVGRAVLVHFRRAGGLAEPDWDWTLAGAYDPFAT
jgi:uncharacterized protein (TIGR02996 family)